MPDYQRDREEVTGKTVDKFVEKTVEMLWKGVDFRKTGVSVIRFHNLCGQTPDRFILIFNRQKR